ncbi:MAG: hypothetical protein NC122_10730 [Faecalibacterium sp.]|nr:hypothetical protein [Ruminococcus sp.]MCM1392062.1 hypothetical protein [Ruminococcus sp.]MCM1486665.1 hypothetical protein [Faecalibacterium sp.]
MEKIFNNNRFYPQNFFVTKNNDKKMESFMKQLSSEAAELSPNNFDAETPYFFFIFKYQPPYDKFKELKRLQTEAISNTRFKSEYNGFIAIDISEWLGHTDEEYFQAAMCFLRDMSQHWKYVFYVDGACDTAITEKAAEDIGKFIRAQTLSIDSIVLDSDLTDRLATELKDTYDKDLSVGMSYLIKNAFHRHSNMPDSIVALLAEDMAMYFSTKKQIDCSAFIEYIFDPCTYARTFMSEEDFSAVKYCINARESIA